jgi:hypothetical protein
VKRNVGGGQQAPSILLDSVPATYVLGEKADDGKPKKDSYFRFKELQVSWTIDDVQVQNDGLSMRAGATVEPKLVEANEIKTRRDALKEALLKSAPNIPCALLLLNN